jgi:hypothetical protein
MRGNLKVKTMNLMGLEIPDWKYNQGKADGYSDAYLYNEALQQGGQQRGSQYWMNFDYKGPEPTLETKAVFSQATYSRDWIGGYAATLGAIGVKLSPGAAAIAGYPITEGSAAIWQQYPAVGPVAAAAANYGQSLIEAAGTAVSKATAPRSGAGQAVANPQDIIGALTGSGLPSWLLPVGLALAAVLVLPVLTRGVASRG